MQNIRPFILSLKKKIFPKKLDYKKWKYSLETRAVLFIFPLELEISEVAVHSLHQNSK